MRRFMLEEKSIDNVVSAPGRHSNDHTVPFCMSTPSAFEVEYGRGGRLIEDATWQA